MDLPPTAPISPLTEEEPWILITEEQRLILTQHFHILLKAFKNRKVFSDETALISLSDNFIQALPESLQTETRAQIKTLHHAKQGTLFQRIFFPKALLKEGLLHALRKAYLTALYPDFQDQIMAQALEFPAPPLEFIRNFRNVLLQIAAGRNIEAKNKYNPQEWGQPESEATALIVAVNANYYSSIVKLLLESGADVNAKDTYGRTALLIAADQILNAEVVQLLLENGADVNATDQYDNTALLIATAASWESDSIVKLLLENGAEVNAKNHDGDTALTVAVRNGRESIVRLLLEKGADVTARAQYYGTALEIAEAHGHKQIVSLLRDALLKRNINEIESDLASAGLLADAARNVLTSIQSAVLSATLPAAGSASSNPGAGHSSQPEENKSDALPRP